MTDINVKITAERLSKSLENLASSVQDELNSAVKNLASAAFASLVSQVQSSKMDPKNRQDYLKGLQFSDMGDNSYVIYLDGEWANKLEGGFPSYNIKDLLLQSKKTVSTGPRAGQPWVRTNKDGGKYAAVPFHHKPHAGGTVDSTIKQMKAFNRQGQLQKITKTFKDNFDNPIAGKVASVTNTAHPFLNGLTKYQHIHQESGKVHSVYLTYRMVSENSPGWQHPGFRGHNFFLQAEKEIEETLEDIVRLLL